MFVDLIFYIFVVLSTINILHFGFFLIGANYFDIIQYKTRLRRRPRAKRPLVSVLIPGLNEEASIIRCLDSVRKNTYRKIEIIMIDDGSTDSTKQLVRRYIKEHPNRNIRLMFKRQNGGKARALNHALKRGAKGDLIMTLDADSVLHKRAIYQAVRYFDDPSVVGVAANVRVMDSPSILNLLQKFEYMVSYRSKKFFTSANCEFVVGGVASTYRRSILRQVGYYDTDMQTEDIALSLKIAAAGNRQNRIIYGVNVIAMTEGVQTFKSLLRQRYRWKMGSMQAILKYRRLVANRSQAYSKSLVWYRLPMAFLGELFILFEPLALAYIVYLSFQIMSTSIFVGAYITITGYLFLTILPDEHLSWQAKLRLVGYSPIMYFIMFTMNIVQLWAMIQCLAHPKQLLRIGAAGHSTWVSPERSGQQQVQFS